MFTNCFAKRLKALPHQSTRQTMDRFVPRDDKIFDDIAITITIVIASEARQSKTVIASEARQSMLLNAWIASSLAMTKNSPVIASEAWQSMSFKRLAPLVPLDDKNTRHCPEVNNGLSYKVINIPVKAI